MSSTVPLEAISSEPMAATAGADSAPGPGSPTRATTTATSSNKLLLSDSSAAAGVMSSSLVSMKNLTRNASLLNMIEKKTSVGNLTPLAKKASAVDLGIRSGSAWIKSKPPEIKDDLKPTVGTPKKSSSLSGFALLKLGAKVLDKQIDEDGRVWVMYQAVDKGPIFYAEDGAESAGQWKKPAIYQDGEDEEVQEVDDQIVPDEGQILVNNEKKLESETQGKETTVLIEPSEQHILNCIVHYVVQQLTT